MQSLSLKKNYKKKRKKESLIYASEHQPGKKHEKGQSHFQFSSSFLCHFENGCPVSNITNAIYLDLLKQI